MKSRVSKEQWDVVAPRLGVDTDVAIADELGVTTSVVFHERARRGIERRRKVTTAQWESVFDRLGHDPDTAIAADLGVTRELVRQKRKALGIPRNPSHDTLSKMVRGYRELLGTAPDGNIAAEIGVSVSVVTTVRNELGIPSYQSTHPPECGSTRRYVLGCRCFQCKRANALRQRARYRASHNMIRASHAWIYSSPEDAAEIERQTEEIRARREDATTEAARDQTIALQPLKGCNEEIRARREDAERERERENDDDDDGLTYFVGGEAYLAL